jgi:hypothetical protein
MMIADRSGTNATKCCRSGTLLQAAAACDGGRGETTTGRGRPGKGHPRPVIGALFRTRSAAYMPAARSWSRSRRDVVGECCGRFSPSGAGASSWRCRATVRLATMAAMAMRLTPKVRISPPIWKVRGARSDATVLPKWQIPCRTIVRFPELIHGVTELLQKLPSLLAVRPYNARDICLLTGVFPRVYAVRSVRQPPGCPCTWTPQARDGCTGAGRGAEAGRLRAVRGGLPGAVAARTLGAPTGGLIR